MLMICSICAFTACSDDDDPTPQNPVSNVRIPATAEIGTEIIVSGTGFASTAQFTFKGTASSADVKSTNHCFHRCDNDRADELNTRTIYVGTKTRRRMGIGKH